MVRVSRSIAVTAAAALLVSALITGVVVAHGDRGAHGFGPRGMGHGGWRALAQLDLTDQQREQIRDIRARHEAELKNAGQRLRSAHEAQRKAVETLPVDEGLIRSTSQQLSDAQADMAILRARVHSEIWTVLTPEQRKKAEERKAQREARMKDRQERREQRREQRRQG